MNKRQRVVANYNAKIQLAERQEAQAERLEEEIERYLFEELGVRKIEDKEIKTGLHFLNYSEIVNWNIDNKDISLFKSSKYEITSILMDTSLADDVFRGKSPKYDSNGNSIILNQKCNRWNHIQIKYAKNVNDKWYASIDEKFFTKENDILINSTGEGTIGRATYMDRNNESLLYDSHILLLRFDISKVNPLFYTYLFNSTYGQKQVEQIKSAQSTKQTELGVSNLKKIVFPIPPLNIQKSIANYIAQLKDQIKSLQTQAKENRTQATVEFEGEIFTTQ